MWTCYQLRYRALSDVSVGFHKLGFVQRTRYFIPPVNFWAAATALAAGRGAAGAAKPDYAGWGGKIAGALRFSCFFVEDGNGSALYPWSDAAEFERRCVGSRGRATIEAASATALPGGLFDLEYLSAKQPGGAATHFIGYVWAAESFPAHQLKRFLDRLGIGGERRYGLGQLQLECMREADGVFDLATDVSGAAPTVTVPAGKAIPAHVDAASCPDDVTVRGELEALTGRDHSDNGPGRQVRTPKLCWAPGAHCDVEATLEVGNVSGIWHWPGARP